MTMLKKYVNLTFLSVLFIASVPTYTMETDEINDITEQVETPAWNEKQQRDHAIISACIIGFCVLFYLHDLYSTGKEPSAELFKATKGLQKRIVLNAKK